MDLYQAAGRFGQRIMVNPKEDLVVVFTASIPDGEYHPHEELYYDYIEEAIIGPPRIVEPDPTTTEVTTSQSTTTNTNSSNTSTGTTIDDLFLVSSVGVLSIVAIVVIVQIRKRSMR